MRRKTAIDEHHGWLRFGWEFVDGSGEIISTGMDVGQLGDDGKLRRIVVFFGDLQPRG